MFCRIWLVRIQGSDISIGNCEAEEEREGDRERGREGRVRERGGEGKVRERRREGRVRERGREEERGG